MPMHVLPWPIYVFIAFFSAFIVWFYIIKDNLFKTIGNLICLSFGLLTISGLSAGILKLLEQIPGYNNMFLKNVLLPDIILYSGFIGTLLLMIGGYIKIKDDPKKYRLAMNALIFMTICIILYIIIILIYKY